MTDAQPMTVETWEIARVRPYEANPRRNDDAVEAVAASIGEFGLRQPSAPARIASPTTSCTS